MKGLLSYDTPHMLHIKSRLGLIYRFVQIAIVAYVVVFVLIIEKGYQSIDNKAVSGTTTKLKGVGSSSIDSRDIWDVSDLVIMSQGSGGFFLTSSVVLTDNQTQTECTELPGHGAECMNDTDCRPVGKPYHIGHGVSTGECNKHTNTCHINSWCDLEDDSPSNAHLISFTNKFTVFIKNHVHFPQFNKTKSNILDSLSSGYIKACRYNTETDPYCPIFILDDIVREAHSKVDSQDLADSIWEEGGVIGIRIEWDCNLDLNTECTPKYHFDRLDDTKYNLRLPTYFSILGKTHRQLVKASGILFEIEIQARARKFDIINLLLNTGSGLGLLGLASVFCDWCLDHLHRHRQYYKNYVNQAVPKPRSIAGAILQAYHKRSLDKAT